MAVSETTIKNGTATTGDFQEFCKAINVAMAAAGWKKTTDTGQIVNTTVTNPALETKAGFEIWTMEDKLQATLPVFLRIDYGNSTATTNHCIWVSLSITGTNGAGVLSAPTSNTWQLNCWKTPGAASYQLWMSGATNRITMFHGVGTNANAQSPFGFTIERDHNTAGEDTTDGVFITTFTGSANGLQSAWDCQYVAASGSQPGAVGNSNTGSANRLPMPWYTTENTTATLGTNVAVIPLFMPKGPLRQVSQCVAGYVAGDITNNTKLSMEEYGKAGTWRTIGTWVAYMDGAGVADTTVTSGAHHGCMIHWE